MNAVIDRPSQAEVDARNKELERIQAEKDAFQMPETTLGEPVVFYEHGVRNGRGSVAFVQKKNEKGLELRLANNLVRPNVPHVDDPRLKYSQELRSDWGAWEQTTWRKKLDETITDYGKRIAELEALVSDPPKKK